MGSDCEDLEGLSETANSETTSLPSPVPSRMSDAGDSLGHGEDMSSDAAAVQADAKVEGDNLPHYPQRQVSAGRWKRQAKDEVDAFLNLLDDLCQTHGTEKGTRLAQMHLGW
eukprot:NODE_1442_length_619_cov_889.424561_g1033_i0.p1 GENE.NODE_1442_length_619_cov_889.424561_g1033_i0~~NODE_1442_length_619_cov_889.424561_g1033_i0.p1  ORF type:complete len:120 (+),score=32.13 NODE_1442_length_619_cov_889.424561_g1033_i0:27-362(+)